MRITGPLFLLAVALGGASCSTLTPDPDDIPFSDLSNETTALSLARRVREVPADVASRYRLVKIYLDELMFDRAMRELREILRLQPRDVRAYELLALVQSKGPENDVDGAIETLRAALRVAPAESSLHADLALRYLDRRDLAAAEQEAKLASDPRAAVSDRATAHLILAGICRLGGRTEEAATHTAAAAELDPAVGTGAAAAPTRFPAKAYDTDAMSRLFATHPESWLRAQRLDDLLRRRKMGELP